jgi:hypothetical protein
MRNLSSAFEKAGKLQSAASHYDAMNFIPALAICFQIATSVQDGAVTLKGSHMMGD